MAHRAKRIILAVVSGFLAVDAAISPRRVLPSEADDRPANLGRRGPPTGPVWVGPVVRDEVTMPTQNRGWLHQQHRPAVTAKNASEGGEDRAVLGLATRTRDLALQHRDLMAQHEHLDFFGPLASHRQDHQVQQLVQDQVSEG